MNQKTFKKQTYLFISRIIYWQNTNRLCSGPTTNKYVIASRCFYTKPEFSNHLLRDKFNKINKINKNIFIPKDSGIEKVT